MDPIINTRVEKMVLRIEVEPGKMILFAVFALISSPYGPYLF
jgi:hypothetical protein